MQTRSKKFQCKRLDSFIIGEVAEILYRNGCTADHCNKTNALEIGVGELTSLDATEKVYRELHELGLKPQIGMTKTTSQIAVAVREADAFEIGSEYAKLAKITFSSAEANTVKEIICVRGQAAWFAVLSNSKPLLMNCEALENLNREHDACMSITNPGITRVYWPSVQETLKMIKRASDPEEAHDLGFKLGSNFRFILGHVIKKPAFTINGLIHERHRSRMSMYISTEADLPEQINEFAITREDYINDIVVLNQEGPKNYILSPLPSVSFASEELRCVGLKEFDPIPLPSKELLNFYRSAVKTLEEFLMSSVRN